MVAINRIGIKSILWFHFLINYYSLSSICVDYKQIIFESNGQMYRVNSFLTLLDEKVNEFLFKSKYTKTNKNMCKNCKQNLQAKTRPIKIGRIGETTWTRREAQGEASEKIQERGQVEISQKIRIEERKLMIAQRKLESIRILEQVFERIQVSPCCSITLNFKG